MASGDQMFLKSAFRREHWPAEGVPEVAFAGRSNVGKSSCLNALTGRRKLARVSKTPGRTQAINFFDVPRSGRLVRFADLPGYGFAKAPKKVRQSWERMIGDYLRFRESLALVVVLVDIRREATDLDQQMIDWLSDSHRTGLVVMTKADKLSRNQALTQRSRVRKGLGVPHEASMAFSSPTGQGKDELWQRIMEACFPPPGEPG